MAFQASSSAANRKQWTLPRGRRGRVLLLALIFVVLIVGHAIWRERVYSVKSMLARIVQSGKRLMGDQEGRDRESEMLAYHEWQQRQQWTPIDPSTDDPARCAALLRGMRAPGMSAERQKKNAAAVSDMVERGTIAWITAVANDGYIRPLVVLAASLDRFSCIRRRIALLHPEFPVASEEVLRKMGYELRRVEKDYSCPSVDSERFKGTFLRLHAFALTEFERLVYIDGDFLVLSNIDEVFAAVSDPREVAAAEFERPFAWDQVSTVLGDNGFNAGMVAFTPQDGLKEAFLLQMQEHCIGEGDQPLLFHMFHKLNMPINMLPFAYNVRKVPYHPMRAFHFAGPAHLKVWRTVVPPSEATDRPILQLPEDVASVFWHFFYLGQRSFQVHLPDVGNRA